MPTIDQLAPAISASDTDELVVSQAGTARKITRAQVLNGLQSQLAVPAYSLLGRISSGLGSPEVISIGQNLSFNGATLSATAAPFLVSGLHSGSVPAAGDLVSISQAGTNVAITYSQFLSGFPQLTNIDLSQGLVRPTGWAASQTLASLSARMILTSGGSLTGPLLLSGNPTAAGQAANKGYVDLALSYTLAIIGGSLTGPLTLSGPPQQPLHAATKSYVDTSTAANLQINGGSMLGSLSLAADPVYPSQASTKHYADLRIARSGDTMTGPLALALDPASPSQAATKNYVDLQVSAALPKSGGTLIGSLFSAHQN